MTVYAVTGTYPEMVRFFVREDWQKTMLSTANPSEVRSVIEDDIARSHYLFVESQAHKDKWVECWRNAKNYCQGSMDAGIFTTSNQVAEVFEGLVTSDAKALFSSTDNELNLRFSYLDDRKAPGGLGFVRDQKSPNLFWMVITQKPDKAMGERLVTLIFSQDLFSTEASFKSLEGRASQFGSLVEHDSLFEVTNSLLHSQYMQSIVESLFEGGRFNQFVTKEWLLRTCNNPLCLGAFHLKFFELTGRFLLSLDDKFSFFMTKLNKHPNRINFLKKIKESETRFLESTLPNKFTAFFSLSSSRDELIAGVNDFIGLLDKAIVSLDESSFERLVQGFSGYESLITNAKKQFQPDYFQVLQAMLKLLKDCLPCYSVKGNLKLHDDLEQFPSTKPSLSYVVDEPASGVPSATA